MLTRMPHNFPTTATQMHAHCVRNIHKICDMGVHARMLLSMNDVHINRAAAVVVADADETESLSRVTPTPTPASTPVPCSLPSSHASTPPAANADAAAADALATVALKMTSDSNAGGVRACAYAHV